MPRRVSPEKRAKFMSAALRLFALKGVQNTSTAEIAREAGTAAGTLFLYFPTKQDLLHGLILDIAREQSASIKALIDPSCPARETFFTIWEGSVRWFLKNLAAYQYIQQVRGASLVDEAVTRESGRYFDYYYAAIQKGIAEGSLKPYPFELIGEFLYQDIDAVMTLIRSHPEAARREAIIHQGFEIFWNGIKSD